MKGFPEDEKYITIVAHSTFLLVILLPFLLFGEELELWIQELVSTGRQLEIVTVVVSLLTLDVFLPVPSSFVNMAATLYLGPVIGFLVVFSGLSIGCCVGYGFGHYFRKSLFDRFYSDKNFRQLTFDLARYGFLTLAITRGMPVMAELSVMAAGYHRYPLSKFLFATLVSNAILAGIYATFVTVVPEVNSLVFLGFTLIAVPTLTMLVRFVWVRLKHSQQAV